MSAMIGNVLAGIAVFGLGFTAGLICMNTFCDLWFQDEDPEPPTYGMGEPPRYPRMDREHLP